MSRTDPNPYDDVAVETRRLRNALDEVERQTKLRMERMRVALLVVLKSDTCTLDPKAEEQCRKALAGDRVKGTTTMTNADNLAKNTNTSKLPEHALVERNGRWSFAGSVDFRLAFVSKVDGGEPTAKQIDAAKHCGPGFAKLARRSFATKAEAIEAAAGYGYEVA